MKYSDKLQLKANLILLWNKKWIETHYCNNNLMS